VGQHRLGEHSYAYVGCFLLLGSRGAAESLRWIQRRPDSLASKRAQESVSALGPISPPITGPTPNTVPGQEYISEAIPTIRDDGTPNGRGLLPPPAPGTYAIQGS
jgi:hypothetical protein